MTLNLHLLNKTLALVESHPELHKQTSWATGAFIPSDRPVTETDLLSDPWRSSCGSTACFAGWAAILGGWHQCRGLYYELVVDEAGRVVPIRTAALEALGVDEQQAAVLFSASNTRSQLAELVDDLNADPDAPLSVDDEDDGN